MRGCVLFFKLEFALRGQRSLRDLYTPSVGAPVGRDWISFLVEQHGYVVGGELRVGLFAGADSYFG